MDFYGAHEHRIDAKGRVALPAVFRDAFVPERVCYIVPERNQNCLAVYPPAAFTELVERLQGAKRDGRFSQADLTTFLSSVSQSAIDGQGRINLPERLLDWAGISRDATLVGAANHIAVFAAEVRSIDAALDELIDVSDLL